MSALINALIVIVFAVFFSVAIIWGDEKATHYKSRVCPRVAEGGTACANCSKKGTP